jgi:MFS superfamily sulfate permease-like transporter
VRQLARFLPFLEWFPLSGAILRADLVAGVTVALVLVPQPMAYAQLAGMPPVYGLYTALLPVAVAALFDSSRQLATGPVAVVSLLTTSALVPIGILIGAGLAVLLFLYRTMRPRVAILGRHPDGQLRDAALHGRPLSEHVVAVRFDGQLYFANVPYFEDSVLGIPARFPRVREILAVGEGINQLDASGDEAIRLLTQGTGSMTLGARVFDVGAGDTVCIPPGTPHRIRNTGRVPLRILCCCSPAYSHDDAQLLQPESAATGVTRSLRATAQSGSAASAFSRPSR